jgi:hypothetical protein
LPSARQRYQAFARELLSYSRHPHSSIKLRILAPLPTTTPESACLCVLSLAFIVVPATAHQWSGLVARGNRSCTSTSQTGPSPVLDGGCTQGA